MGSSSLLTVLGCINTIISMIVCPIVARQKNRSVVGWFFGGHRSLSSEKRLTSLMTFIFFL